MLFGFLKSEKKLPKFNFFKVVFYQNNSQHKSYNENASCFIKHEFKMHSNELQIFYKC